ncbi:GNAT family N-acetyltransferase [Roseisalinus antarcticus]|uniref:Acetyltransferase (GNAT) family protein n=1 Tax=Roseisalinus antarcticus TaxID=254357 RepID=A0A1Y5SZW2_9RHOB|nr:GNAT family N-acetyltransferase [Roseisalinus antarcticus]SLN51933.1 Acetyltransferase (GNAT) family protein [Roseisalinus antarcticus]
MTQPVAIAPVTTAQDGRAVVALVREFFDFLFERYPDRKAIIDDYMVQQDIAGELERLATNGPREGGACLLARLDGDPVGTLMLKRTTPELCEMNRMFVRPAGRGKGVGRALISALFDTARAMGYTEMRLEALDRHHEALPLYRAMGFETEADPPPFVRDTPGVVSLWRKL